jgi:hypothetical protein
MFAEQTTSSTTACEYSKKHIKTCNWCSFFSTVDLMMHHIEAAHHKEAPMILLLQCKSFNHRLRIHQYFDHTKDWIEASGRTLILKDTDLQRMGDRVSEICRASGKKIDRLLRVYDSGFAEEYPDWWIAEGLKAGIFTEYSVPGDVKFTPPSEPTDDNPIMKLPDHLVIQRLYKEFPAIIELFEQYPNNIAIYGDTLSRLINGKKKIKATSPIKIFFYGTDFDQTQTEVLMNCVAMVGSSTKHSASSALTIERTPCNVTVRRGDRAYKFSVIFHPTLAKSTLVFDGRNMLSSTNNGFETDHRRHKIKVKNVGAELRRGYLCLHAKITRESLNNVHASKEEVREICRQLLENPQCQVENDYIQKATEYVTKTPAHLRQRKLDAYYFAEFAQIYQSFTEKQIGEIISLLDLQMRQTAKECGRVFKCTSNFTECLNLMDLRKQERAKEIEHLQRILEKKLETL